LQQLAFRVFDLNENKALYQRYISTYEANLEQKKKALKTAKSATNP
jgi:capsule polysaccharide export protein KpsE/RkpR